MNDPSDLHLTLDRTMVEEAKIFASSSRQSLSAVVSNYLEPLIAKDKEANPAKYASPLRSQRAKPAPRKESTRK